MRESILAALIVLGLLGLGALSLIPWDTLMRVGGQLVAAGMLVGVPLAVLYHVFLWLGLRRLEGGVPKGWIWNPISHHHKLIPGDRRRMLPWFYAGGLSFVFVAIGLVALVVGMISGYIAP